MEPENIFDLIRQALRVTLLITTPILLVGLVVGVVTNVLQAITQINETTVSFLPKLVIMLLAFVLLSPWMTSILLEFTKHLFESIPSYIR